MPNYYFRTVHGDRVSKFGEPVDLADDHAAWEEATIACGEILKDLDGALMAGKEWRMEVQDEAQNHLFTLRLVAENHKPDR